MDDPTNAGTPITMQVSASLCCVPELDLVPKKGRAFEVPDVFPTTL